MLRILLTLYCVNSFDISGYCMWLTFYLYKLNITNQTLFECLLVKMLVLFIRDHEEGLGTFTLQYELESTVSASKSSS